MNELLKDLTEVFPPIEIALPTRGIFYPEGVLAAGVDPLKITVKTLGILDEFKYRDPFMLISGKAIDHLLRHICGDQILIPEEMCEIDIETILLAARLASYGPDLKVKHTCSHLLDPEVPEGEEPPNDPVKMPCGQTNTVQIDLHEFILRYGPIEEEDRFEVKLPRVGQTVYLKPTLYRTAVEVMRSVMVNRKQFDEINENQDMYAMDPKKFAKYEDLVNMGADLQIQSLLDCIYAVRTRSGKMVEDPENIGAWIFELPKSDHDVIQQRVNDLNQDFRKISLIPYVCGKCKQQNEFNLQMNAEILFLVDSEESATKPISSELSEKNKNTLRRPSRISRK